MDTRPLLRRDQAFRPRELAFTLMAFAGFAFAVGAAIELAGLGRELAVAAAVVIVLAFVLVLLRGRPAHSAPRPGPPAGRAGSGDRPLAAERPGTAYYLGVAGGAALALSLGGALFLALPNDHTALAVLLVGVLTWATVILLSLRAPSRR